MESVPEGIIPCRSRGDEAQTEGLKALNRITQGRRCEASAALGNGKINHNFEGVVAKCNY
jgi:hypothetical protein